MQKLKNDRLRLGLFLVLQLATVPTVIWLFKNVQPKETAALFAATLFICLPSLQLFLEYKFNGLKNSVLWGAVLQFLVFFAIPIFVVRVLNPGKEFWTLSVFGIPATTLHTYSSKSFSLLIFATFVYFALTFRRTKASPTP